MSLHIFKEQFRYKPELTLHVGVEREVFLTDRKGNIVPKAERILTFAEKRGIPYQDSTSSLGLYDTWFGGIPLPRTEYDPMKPGEFSYELSACQIESRIGPVPLAEAHRALTTSNTRLYSLVLQNKLNLLHTEVGPADMPLDVYPDPSGRYQEITKTMPRSVLLAACRVIGTHVHIGMPDHETALRVYNTLCKDFLGLCEMGNGSFGERLAIYREMAPNYVPNPYESWEHLYEYAQREGFAYDPRKCWTLIRISVHGTIEFRMFGATDSIERIVSWATRCHDLCAQAMNQGS